MPFRKSFLLSCRSGMICLHEDGWPNMKGIRCWKHQVSSAPAYCRVSAIRRPRCNTTYQALHLRDNLVQLPLGLLVLLDGLLQVSLMPILRPAWPPLTPCFRSHSSRSCSTRVTCLSKCSALTSTCRSLPSDGCLSVGLRAHFSVVSRRSFSALSSSSSSGCTLRARFSPVVRCESPSSAADLRSRTLLSDLSSSSSASESLCCSELSSWSRSSRVWLSYESEGLCNDGQSAAE